MKWILIFMLLLAFQAPAQPRVVEVPGGFTRMNDVIYKQAGDWEGKMDLYLPPVGDVPAPVLIVIHGGGWRHGSKEQMGGFNAWFSMGFAVVNVGYRLSDVAKAPAAVEDIRCAVSFIVNRAAEYHIDPNRIVLSGSSAGGHLALMAGLTGNIPLFENGCKPAGAYQIAAIIARYAPSMLWVKDDDGADHLMNDSAVREWFGDRNTDLFFARAMSPISYVSENSPPVLLVHGDADPRVAFRQSVLLDRFLTTLNVPHRFITVKGGGHGRFTREQQAMVDAETASFLKEHLFQPDHRGKALPE